MAGETFLNKTILDRCFDIFNDNVMLHCTHISNCHQRQVTTQKTNAESSPLQEASLVKDFQKSNGKRESVDSKRF